MPRLCPVTSRPVSGHCSCCCCCCIAGVATTPAAYPGVYLPPPQEPTIPRDYSLKLDQQSSKLRVGESTEVECYSSDNSYTDVIWERADGVPLTSNIQVGTATAATTLATLATLPTHPLLLAATRQPPGHLTGDRRRCRQLCVQVPHRSG